MFIEVPHILILLGAAQGLLIGLVILFQKPVAGTARYLMASALIILSIRLGYFPFADGEYSLGYIFNCVTLLSLLLVGPLIFLFVWQKLNPQKKLSTWNLLHAVPFAYYLLHVLDGPLPVPVCYCFVPLYTGTLYGIATTGLVLMHKHVEASKSLLAIGGALTVVPLVVLGYALRDPNVTSLVSTRPATLPYSLIALNFYGMGWRLLRNPKRFLKGFESWSLNPVPRVDQQKLSRLVAAVESGQLFLDPDFSIQKLSEKTGISRHDISTQINAGLNKSFNQWINEYRVVMVKERLVDSRYRHLSIFGIAMISGFKSKATFNHYFKTITGITPGQFKQSGN